MTSQTGTRAYVSRRKEGTSKKTGREKENVEKTRRSSMRPPGTDKPAATRSISRKKDGGLYRSIRLPASTRLRIQLPLSAGAIYRETSDEHAASKGSATKKPIEFPKLTSRNENITPFTLPRWNVYINLSTKKRNIKRGNIKMRHIKRRNIKYKKDAFFSKKMLLNYARNAFGEWEEFYCYSWVKKYVLFLLV